VRHFFSGVAGESHRNSDGSDRQAIIPKCTVGELLVLEHEPDNPADINCQPRDESDGGLCCAALFTSAGGVRCQIPPR
jgi:hypothetical protein